MKTDDTQPPLLRAGRPATASILLVDDDAELLRALTKVLEKESYEVVAQPNADAAIQYVTQTHQQFDLVITDVSMPGMKGTTFLSSLKTAFPSLPVIIITAFGDWDQYSDALRAGACEYLTKPLDKSELLQCIHRALAAGRPHQP